MHVVVLAENCSANYHTHLIDHELGFGGGGGGGGGWCVY